MIEYIFAVYFTSEILIRFLAYKKFHDRINNSLKEQ